MTPNEQRTQFESVIGSSFRLDASADLSLELHLFEVSDLRKSPGSEAFSLVLLVPEEYTVGQGLYNLQHPVLGETPLFLVPIGMSKDRRLRLEAVFNFLIDEDE